MGTPVVGLFGPSDPRVWGPAGLGHALVYKGIDCRACCSGGRRRGKESCMRQIELDEVTPPVEERLARKRTGRP